MKRYINKFNIKELIYIFIIIYIIKRNKDIELNRECWHE